MRMTAARKNLNKELKTCKRKGFNVRFVKDRRTSDYLAMNDKAAKILGYPLKRKKAIEIDNNMKVSDKVLVLRHERLERGYMAKGDNYWKAHRKALRNG